MTCVLRLATLLSCFLLAACATGQRTGASSASGRYHPRAISPEAAAILARADLAGPGASLVIDVEVLRELGFASSDERDHKPAGLDFLLAVLPAAASQLGPEGEPLVRFAVALGLWREWGDFPLVRRWGLLLRGSPAMGPDQILKTALVVVAVDGSEAANAEYLRGVASLARASAGVKATARGALVCFSFASLPSEVCEAVGPGYLAIGTEAALRSLGQAAPSASTPTASDALLRLKVELPPFGQAELTLAGHAGLKLRAELRADSPLAAEKVEQVLRQGLQKLDEAHERTRAVFGPVLEGSQRAVASDAEAPPSLKASTAALTLERLLDRDGHYAAVRKSISISRSGGALTAELGLPEPLIREVTSGSSLLPAVAVAGVLAAIAVPNFIKFQCRSKQSEARANLKALNLAQTAFKVEKDRFGMFDEIGFAPDRGTRYSYCIDGKCLACTAAGCAPPGEDNPCKRLGAPPDDGFPRSCAVATLGDKLDVWTIDGRGELANVQHGCE